MNIQQYMFEIGVNDAEAMKQISAKVAEIIMKVLHEIAQQRALLHNYTYEHYLYHIFQSFISNIKSIYYTFANITNIIFVIVMFKMALIVFYIFIIRR